VAGTAAYDAYGDQTAQTGASSIFGYAGQETDPTGLQYLRARYLDPASGSFLSPDTVQPNAPGTQGNDLYSYAGDNPTTATDPSGHAALAETGELEGIDVTAFLNDLEAAERVVSAPEEVLQQCAIVAVAQSEGVPAAVPAPPECAALTWLQKLMFLVVITGGATAVASSNPVPSPAGPAPNPSPTPSPKPSPQPGGTGGTQPPTAPPTAGGCTPKEVPEGMAPLPGDANVVRGGAAASQQPKVLEERAECIDDNGNLYGVSVNSAADMSLRSLAEAIPTDSGQPYKSVGSTTVEAIRQAGGDVVPDPQPNNPYHASVQGISAAKLSQLLLNGLTSVGTLPP
jgi:RHS repeat-associated protein